MKNFKFLCLSIFVFCFLNAPLKAQMIEMTPHDFQHIPTQVDFPQQWPWPTEEFKASKVKNIMAPISTSLSKSIKNPSGIRVFNKPIVLKQNGNCMIIKPDTSDCEDCTILWKDLNGDNKIQPKRELKALCKKSKKPCNIKMKKC